MPITVAKPNPRPTPEMAALLAVLRTLRVGPLTTERALGDEMESLLRGAGFALQREAVLGPGDRVDFLCGDIAIELKKKARVAQVPQFFRYLNHDEVQGLILLAARTVDMKGLEKKTKKPCACVSVWGNWGISVG